MASKNTTWIGDWHARIEQYVQRRGYVSVTDFAKANPSATMIELAELLGPDVAAIQLVLILCDEASQSGRIEEFARGLLVRELRDELDRGWSSGEEFMFNLAGAYSSWETIIGDFYSREDRDRLWNWFRHNTDIPEGWLPAGPDDPIIERAFRETGFGKGQPST